jgi:hypothetical protein
MRHRRMSINSSSSLSKGKKPRRCNRGRSIPEVAEPRTDQVVNEYDLMKVHRWIAVCLVLVHASHVVAGEPRTELPKDGWWARYYGTIKQDGQEERTVKRTYSLVGTANANGRKCRWVEWNEAWTVDGQKHVDILKFLVPERDLLESERPLDNLVRAWRKVNDTQVEEVKFSQPLGADGLVVSADYGFGRDFLIFPGAWQKSRRVEQRRTVEYQQGRLEIPSGRAARHSAVRRALTNGEKQAYFDEYTVWIDPAISPVAVAVSERIVNEVDDVHRRTIFREFVIEDFGTDAKSAMPESN